MSKKSRVLMIDCTANKRGWENKVSKGVADHLSNSGVPIDLVVVPPGAQPGDAVQQVSDALARDDYEVLLLVAHGQLPEKVPEGETVKIVLGEEPYPGELLNALQANLGGKVVIAAVCGGENPSLLFSMSEHLVEVVVCTDKSLSREAFEEFVPPLLERITESPRPTRAHVGFCFEDTCEDLGIRPFRVI